MTPVTHRFRRCIGWSCLSEAQKTGIIVSIAVVSIILFLLYMHCLGKAAISRRERASVRLPGGRQVPRPRDQPQGVVVAQLPVTNVAVVHSDDFETVDPHSRLAKPSVQEEVERRMEELSRIYWIPSESSLQPEGSQHSPDQAPVRET
ncbi:hypothetical protein G6O67_007337 [Ophiocordyceps sinensis]|uniref:Uncharacterized protein n=1 Tax=Ophiocordyceps sinensis TaxID=72228 RepID=A0A8H4LTQ5_9HYPO|nr:hypothetical protein G6O67_007337 [Ophiocordyceps sinensis]